MPITDAGSIIVDSHDTSDIAGLVGTRCTYDTAAASVRHDENEERDTHDDDENHAHTDLLESEGGTDFEAMLWSFSKTDA